MGKITFVPAQSLPLDKLVASSANVRRIKAGVSIAELAEDIGRRGLLQSLNVRAVLDEAGAETGKYAVVAGGRRFAALQLLMKAKRLAKNAAISCIVKAEGVAAEEDSLAENTMREALHPLDQFRAFQALRDEHLMGDEEIAARFFVTPAVVRQRLKLTTVSAKLLDLYADDAMTLEQLMAFTVSGDHARQEAVWEALSRSYSREPNAIRRMLTEGAVKPTDKRVLFAGIDAYEAAGGVVERDLFSEDGGGFLRDTALLDRLVDEKLARKADAVRQEGWLWVEAARDLPYGHVFGLRRLQAEVAPLSEDEQAERDRLQAEYDALEAEYATSEDLPEDADRRLGEIEQRLAQLDDPLRCPPRHAEHGVAPGQLRPQVFEAAEVARAGAFVSVDYVGMLKIERGYVRPQDEPREAEPESIDFGSDPIGSDDAIDEAITKHDGSAPAEVSAAPLTVEWDDEDEDDGGRLPERLMTELTAHRTLALRAALSADPDAAYLAVLHALVLRCFYGSGADSCLEIEGRSVALGCHAPTLSDTAASRALVEQHGRWQGQIPRQPRDLWPALAALDADSRAALFALCVGRSVNALVQPWDRRPGALVHADRLAEHLCLDMAAEDGWVPTVGSYLGRVTKARILAAVREGKGEGAADGIAHLRKAEMAEAAEHLLADTGWLPGPLRTARLVRALPEGAVDADDPSGSEPGALPAFLADADEDGPARDDNLDSALAAHPIAAE